MKTYGSVAYNAAERTWTLTLAPDAMGRFKRVFPKIPPKAMKVATLADTLANARDLLWALDRYPLAMSPHDLAHLRRQSSRFREQESVVDRILAAGYVPKKPVLALPPREYQCVPAELCLAQGFILCADTLGLGKTISAICLLADPRALPALIVVPTHLPAQWQRQIDRFLPGLRIHITPGTKVYDITTDKRGNKGPMPDVVITTYSRLSAWAPTLSEVGIKSLVFDEIQALIHDGTDRYAAACHLRDAARYRMGLSGTPLHNRGIEMFHVLHVLGGDEVGLKQEFAQEHCDGGTMASNPKALGAALRRSGWMIRRTKAEVGRELPKLTKIVQPVECDLSGITKIAADLSDLATTILRKSGDALDKMQASGDLDWRLREATGVGKAAHVAAFVRMILENDMPVALFGWHRMVYEIWLGLLSDHNPVLYTGSETGAQKNKNADAFISGKTNLIIISNRSGSGLDGLQHRCSTVVVGELDWTPAWHDQGIGRVHRDGQENPVFAHFPIADEGSDPVLADILGLKRAEIDGICDPDLAMIERLQAPADRMKHLARAWLTKHRPEALMDIAAERVRLEQEAEQAKAQKIADRAQQRRERQAARLAERGGS